MKFLKSAPTLDFYFDLWEKSLEGTVKSSTERSVLDSYRRITAFTPPGWKRSLGRMRLRDIDKEMILSLKKSLSESYNSSTANLTLSLLKRILNEALEDGLIERNPCSGVKTLRRCGPSARETIHRALTRKETRKFLGSAENSFYFDLYRFLLCSGLRCGEAGAVMMSDISTHTIRVRRTVTRTVHGYDIGEDAKTGSGRRDIPLTEELKEICAGRILKNRTLFHSEDNIPDLDGRLFSSPRGGLLIPSNVDQDIRRICLRSGIEPFTAHAFRDTFATRSIEGGMNPKTLQEILGHSSYAITMTLYAHVMPSTKAKEMGKIRFLK
ncbi:MAG: site-specific integrase [Lachnospiraceae bacterium]|nr:site-specific integrase [Lachnospiraceae bacterium]